MTDSPLSIAFLWHMHQPYYRDPFRGIYRLPWVRLHGTKDYLDMVSLLDEFPEMKQTFNLVPSLIEQIIDYTDHDAKDVFLEVTERKASDLSENDRIFILENFFLANWDTMVRPFPRYHELLSKRGARFSRSDLSRIIRYFTEGDFLDLQVLFNLTWIDPLLRKRDPFLLHLVEKGRGYSEEEKKILIEKQLSILKAIIPKYKELSARGQIEISTTPFYHPILPLVWDTDIARAPAPDIRLPKKRFSHPEDARKQIRMALDYYEKIFGHRPYGMWPSEGSVSEDIAKAVRAEGVKWIAADEDVLSRSLGMGLRDQSGSPSNLLYTTYDFSGISIFFRDHKLSDLIGFVYSGWDAKKAAEDLIHRFIQIRDALPPHGSHIVPIILDGENAWEYYENDGDDFLRYLYDGLSRNKKLRMTTFSEYLGEHQDRKRLDRLHAGSWINANFNVWIGHEEDNTAWDYLTETRDFIESFTRANPGKDVESAWNALYVAEGSDWNWWYGDEHSTELAGEFDELFRLNLMKVYKEIGEEIPPYLSVPVLRADRTIVPAVEIRGFINPKIDGIMTSYFEWYHAAYMDVGRSGGSMHMAESLISRIYYGFNLTTLFLRIDPKKSFEEFPGDSILSIEIIRPFPFRIDIPLTKRTAGLLERVKDGWAERKDITGIAIGDILEFAILFDDIRAKANDELNIFFSLRKGEETIERCPWRGYIAITVPTPHFEAMIWY